MNLIKLFLIIFLFNTNNCFSEIVKNIRVEGNSRILKETILEYGDIRENKNYSTEELNEAQKNIYKKGFFEKITINLINGVLTIKVIENPLINFFNIQGEVKSEQLNQLYDKLELKPNKIFSEYILKKDLNLIKEIYINQGYLDAEVIPRIVKIDENKVNILININKNEQVKINRIFFIGDKKFKQSDLADVVTSAEHGWWKFLSSNTIVNKNRISHDSNLLKNFYLNNGYYDIQITSSEIIKINDQNANIVFSINSGNLYKFGELHISEGVNLLNDEAKNFIKFLTNKYFIKKYSLKNVTLFLSDLNDYLGKNIDFVSANINQLKANNQINLNLIILNSKKLHVGKIEISGNSITDSEVILRYLTFSEGDSYLDYKKNNSLDNLRALNIFKKVDMITTEATNGLVDIKIDVSEQPTGSIYAGAGYGTNGANIMFGVNEKNFLGKGISVDSQFSLGTQQIQGYISTMIPDYGYSGKDAYIKLFSQKNNFSNTLYESKKIGADLSTRYQIYENIYFKPGIAIDLDKIDVQSNASTYLLSQDGSYLTQRLQYNIENDKRDKKYNTKNGYILGFSQELATLYSDIPYLKNSFYGSNFYTIFDKRTLTLKYGYSNINTLDNAKDVKLSDRLFLPNQFTKGFDSRAYGPRDSSSADYIGGNNSAYSLASITIPTPIEESWNLDTVFFFNAFNLWGIDNQLSHDSNTIRSSIGIGLDWRSPLGPINFSLASPLTKANSDKTKIFSFEIGTIF